MKKYIDVLNLLQLMNKLESGRRIKGVLYIDKRTGRLTFEDYNIQAVPRQKDELVKKTPWGWVRRSKCRLKRFSSVPLDMTLTEKLNAFDFENRMQKDAAVEEDLVDCC